MLIGSGVDLGADLYHLEIVAKRYFPTVATDYRTAAKAAAADGMAAFQRPEFFGGGPLGPSMTAWTDLRESFVKMLTETAVNLELTSEALLLAVRQYAAADTAAANELSRLLDVNGQPQLGRPVTR